MCMWRDDDEEEEEELNEGCNEHWTVKENISFTLLSLNEDRISFTECEWKNNNKKHIEFPLHWMKHTKRAYWELKELHCSRLNDACGCYCCYCLRVMFLRVWRWLKTDFSYYDVIWGNNCPLFSVKFQISFLPLVHFSLHHWYHDDDKRIEG